MGQSRRLEFDAILRETLGTSDVYYQPPPNKVMVYPCIVYERDNASVQYADNLPYANSQRYKVTLIDKDPDSDTIDKLTALPMSQFNRHFATSGLNHDVFVIYH